MCPIAINEFTADPTKYSRESHRNLEQQVVSWEVTKLLERGVIVGPNQEDGEYTSPIFLSLNPMGHTD